MPMHKLEGLSEGGEVYACVYAGEFPLQALLRLRPSLWPRPVAVVEGQPPLERVCAANSMARQGGVRNGMTRVEAEDFPALVLLTRSEREEQAARGVLLGAALKYTPRVEDAGRGTSEAAYVLDLQGTRKLWGPAAEVARRLVGELAGLRLRVSVAVSRDFHTACVVARAASGVTVVDPGKEGEALAPLLLDALPLEPEQAETLGLWGIGTLGGLAALPERELVARMGQGGRRLRALARGEHPHLFQPVAGRWVLEERFDFESGVREMDSLLFVLRPMLDQLIARAGERALAVAELVLRLDLERGGGLRGGGVHERRIRPALATRDSKLLLKLLQLDLAAHGPERAVVGVVLRAEPGEVKGVQLGLYMPPLPEPSRLDVTLARLRALVGEGCVGSPRLLDTHRRDAWRLEDFVVGRAVRTEGGEGEQAGVPVRRRLRPAPTVRMQTARGRPASFVWEGCGWEIVAASGPWRGSGAWWSGGEMWAEESWDCLVRAAAERESAPGPTREPGLKPAPLAGPAWRVGATPEQERWMCCRVVADRLARRWLLESVYD